MFLSLIITFQRFWNIGLQYCAAQRKCLSLVDVNSFILLVVVFWMWIVFPWSLHFGDSEILVYSIVLYKDSLCVCVGCSLVCSFSLILHFWDFVILVYNILLNNEIVTLSTLVLSIIQYLLVLRWYPCLLQVDKSFSVASISFSEGFTSSLAQCWAITVSDLSFWEKHVPFLRGIFSILFILSVHLWLQICVFKIENDNLIFTFLFSKIIFEKHF